MPSPKTLEWLAVLGIVAIVVAAAAAALGLIPAVTTTPPTVIQGVGSASDGRLNVSLDSYSLALIPLTQTPGGNVYLIANLTIVNVGPGNGSTAGSWWVEVLWNGTTLNNTWTVIPVGYDSGQLANPLTIPPGQRVSGWVAFYLPMGLDASLAKAHGAQLEKLVFEEHIYGGSPDPAGGWVGGTQLRVRFELSPA